MDEHPAECPPSSTQRRILLATAVALARTGESKLRLTEVALEAGVSRPTIYRQFGSKQALLRAFARYERDMFDTGISTAPAGLHGTQRLDAALRFIVDYQNSYSGVRLIDVEPAVVVLQLQRIVPLMRVQLQRHLRPPRRNQSGDRDSDRGLALCCSQ